MFYLMNLCFKALYWMLIGWWLEPIKFFKKRKIQKMQNVITKKQYEQIKKDTSK